MKAGTVVVSSVADDEDEGFAIYGGDTVQVTGDSDGVIVKVEFNEEDDESVATSITGLNGKGQVKYGDATYNYYDNGILRVSGEDETAYYDYGTTEPAKIDLIQLEGGTPVDFVTMEDQDEETGAYTLSVDSGAGKLTDTVKKVLYTDKDEDSFDGTYVVSIEGEKGVYNLNNAEGVTPNVSVEAGAATELTTNFATDVVTEQGTFKLNNIAYTTDEGATFHTKGVTDDTTVVEGTIILNAAGTTTKSALGSEDTNAVEVTAGSIDVVFGGEDEDGNDMTGHAFTISNLATCNRLL